LREPKVPKNGKPDHDAAARTIGFTK
jgi:hypothetical protein